MGFNNVADDADWLRIAAVSELNAKRKLACYVNGISILLCKVATGIVAVQNACTHLGKPLDGGRVIAGQIHCPFHGACFDLKTGEAMSGPAVTPLRRFQVRIEGDDIFIQL
jgi:nitrite reductase/ring-hydroxylating ferredoxin subunit